jgi:hypothetical protein
VAINLYVTQRMSIARKCAAKTTQGLRRNATRERHC